MDALFGVKMLIDYFYYMFFIASLSTCANHSGLLITTPMICAVASAFCHLVIRKKPNAKILKYLPILLTGACFFFTKYTGDIIISIPPICYLAFVIYKNITYIEYDGAVNRFFMCLKLLPAPIFLTVIASNSSGFKQVMLPYFFFFLIADFMFLRMLRHNEKVYTDKRFTLMNLFEMGILCGLGYLFSSGLIVSIVKWIGRMFMNYILRPIFTGITYVLGGIAWVLNKIFGNIDLHLEDVDFSALTQEMQTTEDDAEQAIMEYYEQNSNETFNNIATYVLIGLGAIILIIIIILLFRALSRMSKKGDESEFIGDRETVKDDEDDKKKRLGFSHRDRVRHYYRKFLKMAYRMGVDEDANYCSIDIYRQVRTVLYKPALNKLRDVYLKARYSTNDITSDDVKTAKEAYDGLGKRKVNEED